MNDVATVQPKNGQVSSKVYQRRSAAPPVDVFENQDEVLIVADVPGVSNDGIDLRVENDTLTLIARRPAQEERAERSPALVREYDEVDFEATYRIPAGIDTSAIAAEAKHGTLVVRLPKAAAAKARKIVVRSSSGD
jgi:HSP20 family molecular chaperone IbpA